MISRQEAVRRVALVLLGLMIGAAAGEILARLFAPERHPSKGLLRPLPADPIAFDYIPNSRAGDVEINPQGFRDDPFPGAKDSTETRIVWLGDSIVMGFGVRKSSRYTERMNKQLEEITHRRFRTSNLGVEGYSNYQETLVLDRTAARLNPDLVALGFCWNDILRYEHFVDTLGHSKFLLELGRQEYTDQPSLAQKVRSMIYERSRLAALLRDGAKDLLRRYGFSRADTPHPLTFAEFLDWYSVAWRGPDYDSLKAQIRGMKKRATEFHARFALVLFPVSIQVEDEGEWETHLKAIEQSQDSLLRFCQTEGIVSFDLRPLLRESYELEKEKMFLDVWHLNDKGHEVTARAIATFFARTMFRD